MNPTLYELQFLTSLLLTVVAESIALLLLIRLNCFQALKKQHLSKVLLVVALASFATLPYLWFVLPAFLQNKILFHLIGELSVVLLEALIYLAYFKLDFKKMLLLSVLCNLFSYLVGLLF
jgi:hypothetical protein